MIFDPTYKQATELLSFIENKHKRKYYILLIPQTKIKSITMKYRKDPNYYDN
jgi:hypothetical protein